MKPKPDNCVAVLHIVLWGWGWVLLDGVEKGTDFAGTVGDGDKLLSPVALYQGPRTKDGLIAYSFRSFFSFYCSSHSTAFMFTDAILANNITTSS